MRYKGFLLATASGVALAPTANAADLPTKAPAYAPPPAPISWTGFYVGLNAGAAWQQANAEYGASGAEGCSGCFPGNRANGAGFIGGGQIGYNWQIAPAWVLGLEADISGLSGKATGEQADTGKGNSLEARINWLSTIRARAGWLMNPDTMLYVTGGFAFGEVKNTVDFNGLHGDPFTTKSVSKTKGGWTVGGGMEHMINRNWTVGIEALWVDLGNTTGVAAGGKTTQFKNTAAIARLKVNYKFW